MEDSYRNRSFYHVPIYILIWMMKSTYQCLELWQWAPAVAAPETELLLWPTHSSSVLQYGTHLRRSCAPDKITEFPLYPLYQRLIIYFKTLVQQNDGKIQMLKQNLSRGEMVLGPQAQLLKQRGVSLYSTVAKVAQWRDYFNSLWECPLATIVRSNDKLYIVPVCKSWSSNSTC